MGLTLGFDFGTSTTCIAVFDRRSLTPQVVDLGGDRPYVRSHVWIDRNGHTPSIVESKSVHGRSPKCITAEAVRSYEQFWQQRMHAYSSFQRRAGWERDGREGDLLLSMFKPELADTEGWSGYAGYKVEYVFDPLSQSSETVSAYSTVLKWLADPAPDTSDYVAATAALLSELLGKVVRETGDRIDGVAFGPPSIDDSHGEEFARAKERRAMAVAMSAVASNFGSRRFRAEYLGEALAAACTVELPADVPRASVLVLDVGAGTTDMSVVSFEKEHRSRWRPRAELLRRSLRIAGRDINRAVAAAMIAHPQVRAAYAAMEQRTVHHFLDNDVEQIKLTLLPDEQGRRVRFFRFAVHPDGPGGARKKFEALNRGVDVSLGLKSVEPFFRRQFRAWEESVEDFLQAAGQLSGGSGDLVGAELVGGAFRFPPLRATAERLLARHFGPAFPVSYRDANGVEAQTAVARGLARMMGLGWQDD